MVREPNFLIGCVPVYGDAIIAPMSGYTDSPFRRMCREHGSAMSYTGLVNKSIMRSLDAEKVLDFSPDERPIIFNVVGRDGDIIEEICRRLEEVQPDVIDINMGCPSRKVVLKNQGAYLLRYPEKIACIMKQVTAAISIPVSAKIRLGWDRGSRNFLDIAKIIEDNGAAMLAVHGRTKEEGYDCSADWDAIAEIKRAVRIPVLGNGDIRRAEDIGRMKEHTGCDAVLIGRAAIGNPWIFQRRDREDVSPREMFEVAKKHLYRMIDFYGRYGLIKFRKHAVAYFKNTAGAAGVRRAMMMAETPEEFLRLLSSAIPKKVESEGIGR